jgi:hypothetical protein
MTRSSISLTAMNRNQRLCECDIGIIANAKVSFKRLVAFLFRIVRDAPKRSAYRSRLPLHDGTDGDVRRTRGIKNFAIRALGAAFSRDQA